MNQEITPLPQTEEELMPAILQLVPGFKDRWEEHNKSWHDEPAGIYNDIAEFAHYLVDSYETEDTSWYASFFFFIESLLVSGNNDIKELASIGFLEDIQTISSWRSHKGKIFIEYLGPQSKKAWDYLDKLWSKYGSLANIVRAEGKRET